MQVYRPGLLVKCNTCVIIILLFMVIVTKGQFFCRDTILCVFYNR